MIYEEAEHKDSVSNIWSELSSQLILKNIPFCPYEVTTKTKG